MKYVQLSYAVALCNLNYLKLSIEIFKLLIVFLNKAIYYITVLYV